MTILDKLCKFYVNLKVYIEFILMSVSINILMVISIAGSKLYLQTKSTRDFRTFILCAHTCRNTHQRAVTKI